MRISFLRNRNWVSASAASLSLKLRLVIAIVVAATSAYAEINVNGDWQGYNESGGVQTSLQFTLEQQDGVVTGLVPGDSTQGTILGSIDGNQFVFRIGYNELGYSVDYTAITDGLSIAGTFIDSLGGSGVISMSRLGGLTIAVPLTPATQLTLAPTVQVSQNVATLTLQKFSKLKFSKSLELEARALFAQTTIRYEVAISGSDRRRLTSKRNILSVKNLKPGNYQVTYRVTALKNGKAVFSTRKSPSASFAILP